MKRWLVAVGVLVLGALGSKFAAAEPHGTGGAAPARSVPSVTRTDVLRDVEERLLGLAEQEAMATLRVTVERTGIAPTKAEFGDADYQKTIDAIAAKYATGADASARLKEYLKKHSVATAPAAAVAASQALHRATGESAALLARYGAPPSVLESLGTAKTKGLGRAGLRREAAVDESLRESLGGVRGLDAEAQRTLLPSMRQAVLKAYDADAAWMPSRLVLPKELNGLPKQKD